MVRVFWNDQYTPYRNRALFLGSSTILCFALSIITYVFNMQDWDLIYIITPFVTFHFILFGYEYPDYRKERKGSLVFQTTLLNDKLAKHLENCLTRNDKEYVMSINRGFSKLKRRPFSEINYRINDEYEIRIQTLKMKGSKISLTGQWNIIIIPVALVNTPVVDCFSRLIERESFKKG